jgi:hypothetical protein
MKRVLLIVLALAVSCSEPAPPPRKEATPTASEAAPAPVIPVAPPVADGASLRLKAIDLQGKPLSGMVPIATRNPNATDYPVASGAPSSADGAATLAVPAGELVYVRMWDPTFQSFANNYYDVDVGADVPDRVLEITMVPSASISVTLLTAANAPAAQENVGLMMFHPVKGPWWPAESTSDDQGVVRFPNVPAGQYSVKLKALRSGEASVPEVALAPGVAIDMGSIVLNPPHEPTAP